jgi:hypothetical protein
LISELVRDLNLKTVLIIGGDLADEAAGAVLQGTSGSDDEPLICCIDTGYLPPTSPGATPVPAHIKPYPSRSATESEALATDIENVIRRHKCDNLVERFDLVIVARPETAYQLKAGSTLHEEMVAAKLVILADLESEYHRWIYTQLLAEPDHVFLDHSTARGNYVIFAKLHSKEKDESVSAGSWSSIYAD